MEQLLAHLCGDYILQSDWMANGKRQAWQPAIAHGLMYSIAFLWLTTSPLAWLVILVTHVLIDHYGLARYVVWAKNYLAPHGEFALSWKECEATGYPPDRPAWLAVWLLIIADNTLHLTINYLALRFL